MTLRARLTGAFLAVVLGPVLVGAVFAGGTVAAINRDRSIERLDLATSSVRASVAAICRHLRTVAESIAALTGAGQPASSGQRLVDQGLVWALYVTDLAGSPMFGTAGAAASPLFTTPEVPPAGWADCAGTSGGATGVWRYEAISARVEVRDAAGAAAGHVYAAQALDLPMLRQLAVAAGAGVTLLAGTGGEQAAPAAALSTEPHPEAAEVLAVAPVLAPGAVGNTPGRYLRRDGPAPDQPLPLVLSVPHDRPGGLSVVLVGVVLLTAVFAVAAAWWLARATTRPLAELSFAARRVAGGDLAVRVPVRSSDELGRLGTAFNRMTREMQSYVQALTASRDQLRGHLGVLGDTLSSTHDLGRILQVLLQTALAATGARAGVVLLTDPTSGVLIGQWGEGLENRLSTHDGDASGLRVPIGSGLLGSVAATREARCGRVDRDGPALSPAEPRCRTYVAVPFSSVRHQATVPEGNDGATAVRAPVASGVLALYDRLGQDEFDDADLVTLRTFAGQAAVALDNVRVHEEAQRLSVTDPLTGLLNYRSLRESVRREVERAARFGRRLGVLALDLDRFKEVNDSYGHAAGDAVLAEFARRIRAEVREVDLAFRQGGEEFVVLLPETDAAGAAVVAQRLGTAIRSAPIVVATGSREVTATVTVSIGIAVYPDHGPGGSQVLEAADHALYAAKAAGRDTYRIAPSRPAEGEAGAVPATVGEPEPSAGTSPGGVAGGAHPPRQSRGR